MEFYALEWICRHHKAKVSIPNGMEFYSSLSSSSFFCARFNSQRDGILHAYGNNANFIIEVSIPNGMEFYATSSCKVLFSFGVSIPNGMEFYLLCLGSQRFALRFQFPTGWNSTLAVISSAEARASFNSQRDGILREVRIF